jgi:hypothetical protein
VIGIERNESAVRVRVGRHTRDVDDARRPEQDVRNRDERRAFVDRSAEALLIDREAVVTRHDDDARAEFRREFVEHISDARKIERTHDDGIATFREID